MAYSKKVDEKRRRLNILSGNESTDFTDATASEVTTLRRYRNVCTHFYYVLRNNVLQVLRDIIERRMKGKAYRGRKRLHMLSDIASSAKLLEVKAAAEDRQGWTAINRKAAINLLHTRSFFS